MPNQNDSWYQDQFQDQSPKIFLHDYSCNHSRLNTRGYKNRIPKQISQSVWDWNNIKQLGKELEKQSNQKNQEQLAQFCSAYSRIIIKTSESRKGKIKVIQSTSNPSVQSQQQSTLDNASTFVKQQLQHKTTTTSNIKNLQKYISNYLRLQQQQQQQQQLIQQQIQQNQHGDFQANTLLINSVNNNNNPIVLNYQSQRNNKQAGCVIIQKQDHSNGIEDSQKNKLYITKIQEQDKDKIATQKSESQLIQESMQEIVNSYQEDIRNQKISPTHKKQPTNKNTILFQKAKNNSNLNVINDLFLKKNKKTIQNYVANQNLQRTRNCSSWWRQMKMNQTQFPISSSQSSNINTLNSANNLKSQNGKKNGKSQTNLTFSAILSNSQFQLQVVQNNSGQVQLPFQERPNTIHSFYYKNPPKTAPSNLQSKGGHDRYRNTTNGNNLSNSVANDDQTPSFNKVNNNQIPINGKNNVNYNSSIESKACNGNNVTSQANQASNNGNMFGNTYNTSENANKYGTNYTQDINLKTNKQPFFNNRYKNYNYYNKRKQHDKNIQQQLKTVEQTRGNQKEGVRQNDFMQLSSIIKPSDELNTSQTYNQPPNNINRQITLPYQNTSILQNQVITNSTMF